LKVIELHKTKFSTKVDEKIIKQLKSNNRKTQQHVFERYSPKMLSVCRQYIRDLQKAEEIMLNGFLKVFTKISDYKSKGSFEGWIRRIMVNESISYLRLKKRLVFVEDDTYFKEEVDIDIEDDVSELQKLVDNLRADLRVVFNLFVMEDYKHQDIADLLNITENASKLRYRKARQLLKEQYTNQQNKHYGK
jgi:RNA polymerase sigma-70 factor (ECF subfamily)